MFKHNLYRFNRKTGLVYLEDRYGEPQPVGDSLDLIILHAAPPIHCKPFTHLAQQTWIRLCFLDPKGEWSYGLLGSGESDALKVWNLYLRLLIDRGLKPYSVITRISFEQVGSGDNSFHDFVLSFREGKPGLEARMKQLVLRPKYPLINPNWCWD